MSQTLAAALRAAQQTGQFEALIQGIPYASFIGMQAQMDGAAPLFQLPYQELLVGNPAIPALHGGSIAGFMENAGLLHVLWAHQEQRIPKSIDFSIDYLRSARTRDSWARCQLVRQGRRVALAQISCWQDDEQRPVAVARAHFLLQTAPERN